MVKSERVRRLNDLTYSGGAVCYWMDRDERLHDNWAFLYAQQKAKEFGQPLIVVFNLVPGYLHGGARQWDFKLRGLKELEETCKKKGIPFVVLVTEKSGEDLLKFFKQQSIGLVVTDFSPVKSQRKWKDVVAKGFDGPLFEVDAHNIVPVWIASEKKEFAARTFRPKVTSHLREFLEDFPSVRKQTRTWQNKLPKNDWKKWEKENVNEDVARIDLPSGEKAAKRALKQFIENRLRGYDEGRNDPSIDGQSNLSPYLHYGQIAPARVAFEVKKARAPKNDKDAYLEELIVRRELSDNFCYYEQNYDSVDGFENWAKRTLDFHRRDKREHVYTQGQFEKGKTHSALWNAAQLEMVRTGKMHGYMRMFWAKKIFEWTKTPEDAMKIAIYLNDKYELDGRDPNGYTGIAWSIGGVHDRAWFERDVFGKIRYMNENGCRRKFDVDAYIANVMQDRL